MNIIVTVKQVPDTNNITIDPVTGTLNREGVPAIVNPEDKNAVEAALALKEQYGGKIIAISMGPPQAEKALREAMSMGVDEAILLSDRSFAGADTLATAYALSCAVKKIKDYDLIICGRQAIDGDTAQTGPQLSEFLKIPQITYVREVKIENKNILAKSVFGNVSRLIEARLPALITVTKEMNAPRYPSIKGIVSAYREKKVVVWTSKDVDAKPMRIGLSGSPTQVRKTFSPKHEREGKVFTGAPGELAQNLKDVLVEHNYV
jgi:electron transfer flavoprotein beta subunit